MARVKYMTPEELDEQLKPLRGTVKIDTSQIPEAVGRSLGATFFELIKEYYKDPKNMREYEEWREKREREKLGTA